MKPLNSIWRTLYLVALLCTSSLSASAYKVFEGTDFWNTIMANMGEEKILVIEESFETEDFIVPAGYAVVIMPDAMATVTKTFNNNGDIYIFGGLYLEQSVVTASNYSNIILTGTLEGQPINHLQGGQISHQPYSPRKVAGHFPVTATSGWESY